MVSDPAVLGALGALAEAHAFVVEAVLQNVRVEDFDPNSHTTAVRIRLAVDALGGDSQQLLDERRCTPAIGDEFVVDDIEDDDDSDWDYDRDYEEE